MEIIRGKKKKPFNVMLLGIPGIGKSTWAASCPSPIFITAEEIDELDAARLPQLTKFDQIFEALDFVKKHDEFKTVVIDTIDSVERLLHQKILEKDPKGGGSMAKAHGGYGKAYDMALTEMTKVKDVLRDLRDSHGKNIVLLCHTKTKKTADTIIGAEYDEFKSTLHEKVESLFVDWVSAVLFANYVTHLKDSDNSRDFALGDGERIILTEKRPGHLAKNRYELPYELEMPIENPSAPFVSYYEAFYGGRQRSEKEIRDSIQGLVRRIDDENLVQKIVESVNKAKGLSGLVAIEKRIKERMGVA
jgi:hypothetical protein